MIVELALYTKCSIELFDVRVLRVELKLVAKIFRIYHYSGEFKNFYSSLPVFLYQNHSEISFKFLYFFICCFQL